MMATVKRSEERMVFHFKTHDTPTSVKRKTLKSAANLLGMDETSFLHLAAARLVAQVRSSAGRPGRTGDDGRISEGQIAAIRAMEPQDFAPTRSFLDLLGK